MTLPPELWVPLEIRETVYLLKRKLESAKGSKIRSWSAPTASQIMSRRGISV